MTNVRVGRELSVITGEVLLPPSVRSSYNYHFDYLLLFFLYITFYTCIVPMRFLPREIRVASFSFLSVPTSSPNVKLPVK